MTPFQGLSAFPITPTDARGRVDTDALGRLLERLHAAGVDSIGLLGSTGGYMYLTREERRRAIVAAVGSVGGRTPLIVGVGALRTDEAETLARDAASEGADALLLAPVSYTPLTEEEAYQHYCAVARATDLPLCLYNNPGTTHFTFSDALLRRLAAVPNIKAVKMPLPKDMEFKAELDRLRPDSSGDFAIGYSGDWGAADALLAGADAWYSVVGGLLPDPALRLVRAAQAGDVAEVRRINSHFQPLWDLFKEFGSIRVVYAAANILSLCEALPPRPILPLTDADCRRVASALDALSGLMQR
ncbi:dihydrodipicolinate synthase family protein [Microvirga sp. VF16]|uniref:dihydrodipicolinate synthase family protein n=1 Tax=Microvirga sp. VF16 TaxID=2807101 RepID=UPI00193D039E|nr:dihydrodipicolinate synthase family protein [Microvirga sp. VF16]QRM32934.1 dihydrodipicolinate synthase family protein [Microvirga sp. VF16]